MQQAKPQIAVPDGFKLHTENTTHILVPDTKDTFLNPVQEFNRDISVACIRVWSEELDARKKAKWHEKQERKAGAKETDGHPAKKRKINPSSDEPGHQEQYHTHRISVLEPLSATGLRSIRYAKEIPLLRSVIANDISQSAVESITRNISLNDMGPSKDVDSSDHDKASKISVRLGDACNLMYSQINQQRVDCIDLDPYGTAAPFIDAAVQALADGGLLCVTCTDLAVLATTNYPEKCFSNYGGVPVKAEYCHEVALRLVLHLISSAAARYGRYVKPLLSLSVDFYVRLFLEVRASPLGVKSLFSQTGIIYVCSFCQTPYVQPFGRAIVKESGTKVQNTLYKTNPGPPCSGTCDECASVLHLSGPMWIGPLHDKVFTEKLLAHVESAMECYNTSSRMQGMISTVHDELDEPFYFTAPKLASFFNCLSPSLEDVASALLNKGFLISRSHTSPGSIKTSATRADIHNLFRSWIASHPVVMKNVPVDSPKRVLLQRPSQTEFDFTPHHQTQILRSNSHLGKLVRYQQNPTPNWGPAAKARPSHKENNLI